MTYFESLVLLGQITEGYGPLESEKNLNELMYTVTVCNYLCKFLIRPRNLRVTISKLPRCYFLFMK